MKVTPNIICEEFIGTTGSIANSPHSDYLPIHGNVIGETQNTFTLLHNGVAKRVVKNQAVFQFQFSDGTTVEIDGKLLVGKPEDRVKKTIKRLW